MKSRHKIIGLVSLGQSEILKELFNLYKQCGESRYWKPRDIGAYRSSHHARTLRKLESQGLVVSKVLPGSKHYEYRISNEGVDIWQLVLDIAELPSTAIFGGKAAQQSHQTLQSVAF